MRPVSLVVLILGSVFQFPPKNPRGTAQTLDSLTHCLPAPSAEVIVFFCSPKYLRATSMASRPSWKLIEPFQVCMYLDSFSLIIWINILDLKISSGFLLSVR